MSVNKKFWVFSGLLLSIVLFFLVDYVTTPKDCVYTYALLHNQMLGLRFVCDDCLVFNVTELQYNQLVGNVTTRDVILYFEREHKFREDFPEGDVIRIRWCNVYGIDSPRIRGVERPVRVPTMVVEHLLGGCIVNDEPVPCEWYKEEFKKFYIQGLYKINGVCPGFNETIEDCI